MMEQEVRLVIDPSSFHEVEKPDYPLFLVFILLVLISGPVFPSISDFSLPVIG